MVWFPDTGFLLMDGGDVRDFRQKLDALKSGTKRILALPYRVVATPIPH